MVFANEIDKFEKAYQKMRTNFSRYSVFIDYFDKNWINCKQMWTECYREKTMNLGEKTNNRIESLNSHLKQLGNYSDTLLECYTSLMTSFSTSSNKNLSKNMLRSLKFLYILEATFQK